MTNQEILTKAIQKAIDNGWKYYGTNPKPVKWWLDTYLNTGTHFKMQMQPILEMAEGVVMQYCVASIIYNHDFAKALWPIEHEMLYTLEHHVHSLPEWQYHLQQMVIADDPVKYLGENI